jgi:hypothetical protein
MQFDDDSWGSMSEANQRRFAAEEQQRQERLAAADVEQRRQQREDAHYEQQWAIESARHARQAAAAERAARHRPAAPARARPSSGASLGVFGMLVAVAGIGWVATHVEGGTKDGERRHEGEPMVVQHRDRPLENDRRPAPPIAVVDPLVTEAVVAPRPTRDKPPPDRERPAPRNDQAPPPIDALLSKPSIPAPPTAEPFTEFRAALAAATAELDAGQFEAAKSALEDLDRRIDAAARRDHSARPLLTLARFRLAEAMRGRGLAAATRSRDDETAAKLLHNAARAFAALEDVRDQGNPRDGSSLRAAALRWRAEIHARLHVGYRDLSRRSPGVSSYRSKLREHQKAALACVERLQADHADAQLADGRRVVDVVQAEIRSLTH